MGHHWLQINIIPHLIQAIPPYEPQKTQAFALLKKVIALGFSLHQTNELGQNNAVIAVHRQNPEALKILIEYGVDFNLKDQMGKSALDYAVDSKNPFLLSLLEQKTKNHSPQAGLFLALQSGKPEDLKSWLHAGGNILQADLQGNTALHMACEKGISSLIPFLIENGSVLDAQNLAGKTPLELAAQNGFYEPVRILIQRGARFSPDLTISITETKTQLDYGTTKKKDSGFVFYGKNGLISHSHASNESESQIITQQVKYNFPLFIFAFMKNDKNIYTSIITRVNLNLRGFLGETPLHWAVKRQDPDTVKKLIHLGVLVQTQDHRGYSPLHTLAENFESPWGEEIFKMLSASGAQIDAQTEQGNTPLHCAILFKKTGIVKLLIQAGANPEKPNRLGETALHRAFSVVSQNPEIFKILLDRKPPLNLQDNEGNTSLHYAVKSGNLEAVKILLQAGADSKIKNKRNYTPLDFSQDLVPELRQKMQKIIKP